MMKLFVFSVVCFLSVSIAVLNYTGNQTVQGSNNFPASRMFVPPAVQLQTIVSGLTAPLYMTARDARLFIVQQDGRIKIFQSGALLSTPFLDIASITNYSPGGERGLIGFAFHPNYPTTPYIFVHFTSNGTTLPDGTTPASGNNVIARFNVSGNANVIDFSSEKTLLVIPQPFSNHNGGMIEFSPTDGYLYIGKGDGGDANDPGNRAQNTSVLLGKILRIDVNQNVNVAPYYAIPSGNPIAGSPVFLIGLRNPFRFSFDRSNGDLWIGDVGQGAHEEIDHLPINSSAPGKNLGWRIYEGNFCTNIDGCGLPANYLAPVTDYGHTGGRCSITGGYVYRGTQIPALAGSYVYGDYCSGEIFRLSGATQEVMLDTAINISSFGEDGAGELYVTALSGQLYKIVAAPTAASAAVSGRIVAANGRGVSGAVLELTGGNLTEPLAARTNPSGFYRFPAVAVGQNYIIKATAKNRDLEPSVRVFTLLEDLPDIDFTVKQK